MLHRLVFQFLFFLAPRVLPRIIRYLRLAWRLQWDKRVHIVLRAVVPIAIVYALSPLDLIKDRVPIIGRFDDLIILALAVILLVKLSPKMWSTNTWASHAPNGLKTRTPPKWWTARPGSLTNRSLHSLPGCFLGGKGSIADQAGWVQPQFKVST